MVISSSYAHTITHPNALYFENLDLVFVGSSLNIRVYFGYGQNITIFLFEYNWKCEVVVSWFNGISHLLARTICMILPLIITNNEQRIYSETVYATRWLIKDWTELTGIHTKCCWTRNNWTYLRRKALRFV